MKLTAAILLSLCVTVVAENTPVKTATFTPAGHTTDTLNVVKQRLKDRQAILLDVREKDEWADGHLKGAKLMPLSVVRARKLSVEMKKNLVKTKPVYVHCASGGRVLRVSKILRAQGYDIRPLRQGYAELLSSGFQKAAPTKKQP